VSDLKFKFKKYKNKSEPKNLIKNRTRTLSRAAPRDTRVKKNKLLS